MICHSHIAFCMFTGAYPAGSLTKRHWNPLWNPDKSRNLWLVFIGFPDLSSLWRVNPVDPRWLGCCWRTSWKLVDGGIPWNWRPVWWLLTRYRTVSLNKHAVYFGMSKGTFKAKNPIVAGWWGCVKTYFVYLYYLINMLFSASFLIGVDQWPYVHGPKVVWYTIWLFNIAIENPL